MVERLTTEDMQALNLQDAFAEKQYTEGVAAGTGLKLGNTLFDYFGNMTAAKLAEEAAKQTTRRGKRMRAAAGAGAAERLQAARGQKQALARDVVQSAATRAAMDPTGASAVEFARSAPSIVQRAGDVSEEQTQEMKIQLAQEAAAEETIAKGEQQKLLAKQAKARERLRLGQEAFKALGEGAQALKPRTFEAKQQDIAARQGKKIERLQEKIAGRQEKLDESASGVRLKDLTSQQRRLQEKNVADFAKLNEAKRTEREALARLKAIQEAERKKLQLMGGVLADPLTPTTE